VTSTSEEAASREPEGADGEDAAVGVTRRIDLRRVGRIAATLAGGALVVRGLRRRSLAGLAGAVAGGALLYGGLRSTGPLASDDADAGPDVYRREPPDADRPGTVSRRIIVGRPAEELAEYWRDPDQLSRILGDAVEVSEAGEDQLRWTVDGPFDRAVSWQTRLAFDRPGEELRWQVVDGAVGGEVTVSFEQAEGGDETTVTLSARLEPPGGAVGRAVADRLLPAPLLGTALDRFKSLAETGEIPSLEANPSGRGAGDVV
jgi:uncharacterized membrane protein